MPYKDRNKQRYFDREWKRKQRVRYRKIVFDLLGNKCLECGIKDDRVLQVDHIEPIRRHKDSIYTFSGTLLYQKIALGKLNINLFQLLCANCHQIKTVTKDRLKFKTIRATSDNG